MSAPTDPVLDCEPVENLAPGRLDLSSLASTAQYRTDPTHEFAAEGGIAVDPR